MRSKMRLRPAPTHPDDRYRQPRERGGDSSRGPRQSSIGPVGVPPLKAHRAGERPGHVSNPAPRSANSVKPSEAAAWLARNAVDCLPESELERKLATGRQLRVKLGIDPTAPDIHL